MGKEKGKKKKPGPKTDRKKDEATRQKIIEGHRADLRVREICAYAGISRDTYYRRKDNDKELSDRIDDAKQYLYIVAKNTVAKGVKEDKDFALKRLSKRQKDRYGDAMKLEAEVNVNLSQASDEELEKIVNGRML